MWRLIYSKRKLKPEEKIQLQQVLDDMSFSCGAQLQELDDIPAALKDIVFVREMTCGQPIEKLYYAARFDNICVYCAEVVSPCSNTEQYYPQCSAMTVQRNPQSKKKNSRKRKSDYVIMLFFSVSFCIHENSLLFFSKPWQGTI